MISQKYQSIEKNVHNVDHAKLKTKLNRNIDYEECTCTSLHFKYQL